MSKKDEIVSIDLDEEREKKREERKIEITAGDIFVRVPENKDRIEEVIRVLNSFVSKLADEKKVDLREKIEKDIKETKQFLEDTDKIENKVKEKTEPIREEDENQTVLNEGKRYDRCPNCKGKLKKKKIQQFQDGFVQVIKCKNRKCGWTHTYKIEL